MMTPLQNAAQSLAAQAEASPNDFVSDIAAVGETVCFTILGETFCAVVEFDENTQQNGGKW